ncbi:MAG: hypothetical protein L6R41_007216 [Letrouitia leprolyta]|nr:MAG: hypothetical protein L6R41_007216 [Letrouitia leprolyta]
MNYLIDDMLGSSRRGSTRTTVTSPTQAEPPLPPVPSSSSSRSRKSKSVKSWAGQSSAAAAAIPLPETPVPSTVPPGPVILSPNSAAIPVAKPDYFAGAEPASPAGTSADLGMMKQTTPDPSTLVTQLPELPQADVEVPPPVKISTEAEGSSGEAPVVEEQQSTAQNDEDETSKEASAAKKMPPENVEIPPPTLHIFNTPVPIVRSQPAIMIGLSGSPVSGKTTLAHLFSLVLPPTTPSFMIHQDDFFVRKHLLIPNDNGGLEINYRRSVDFPAFKKLIGYSKREGRLPEGFRSLQSKGDQENALSQVSPGLIEQLRAGLADLPGLRDGRPIGIVVGFLLYHSSTIRSLLDIKFLLRASEQASRIRRSERIYDTPAVSEHDRHAWETVDYFDQVLWPNYVDEHAVLFEDGNVEGKPIPNICQGVEIHVQPDLNMGFNEVLQWVVDVFKEKFEEAIACQEREMFEIVEEYAACNCNEGFFGKIRQAIFDSL